MAKLFQQAARQERQRFFWRLDAQWGHGLRQRTNPDHLPLRGYAQEPSRLEPCGEYPRTHLVKPSSQHGWLAPEPEHVVDVAPNSGLHFIRGVGRDTIPSRCTALMSNTVDYTALGLPWPAKPEVK
jgi:hypothetical protein